MATSPTIQGGSHLVANCNGVDSRADNKYYCRFPGCTHTPFTASFPRCRHEGQAHPPPLPPPIVNEMCLLCMQRYSPVEMKSHKVDCASNGTLDESRPMPAVAPLPRRLLDHDIDTAFAAFNQWLCMPGATMWSQPLKKSIPPSASALETNRQVLRVLVDLCHTLCPTWFIEQTFYPAMLIKKEFVLALHQHHTTVRQRAPRDGDEDMVGIGPHPVNRRNLMLRKLLVYHAETMDISAPTFECWLLLQQTGHQSNKARHKKVKKRVCVDDQLTADDLIKMTRLSMERLDNLRRADFVKALCIDDKQLYSKCLWLLLTCQLQGQRPQVVRQMSTTTLRAPHTAYNDSDSWKLFLDDGDKLKNGRPADYTLHPELSNYMRFYITRVLPIGHLGSIWMTERGTERTDFGDFCNSIVFTFTNKHATPQVLRRAVATKHALVATTFADQRMSARVQDHSVAVAERDYIEAQVDQKRMQMADDDLRAAKRQRLMLELELPD